MKNQTLIGLAITFAGALVFSACATRSAPPAVGTSVGPGGVITTTTTSPGGEVTLTQTEPPPPRHEAIPYRTDTTQVWVPGFWMNDSGKWIWIPGHYETPEKPGSEWVSGEWLKTPSGWRWQPGHWQSTVPEGP